MLPIVTNFGPKMAKNSVLRIKYHVYLCKFVHVFSFAFLYSLVHFFLKFVLNHESKFLFMVHFGNFLLPKLAFLCATEI